MKSKSNSINSGAILSYQKLIKSKKINPDAQQKQIIDELGRIEGEFESYYNSTSSFFGKIINRRIQPPKGLYIHGGVGRGKSMLMDLFYESIDSNILKKRTHFQEFMSDVHTRIKAWHDDNSTKIKKDVITEITRQMAKEYRVLCFDEVYITDIADAMIIGRIFDSLLKNKILIVATSNRHPDDLYKNGLHRDRFLPFIEMFKNEMQVFELGGTEDYRFKFIESLDEVYLTPANRKTEKFLIKTYDELTKNVEVDSVKIMVRGREIKAKKSVRNIAYFDFKELCEANLGSEDYNEIASLFETIFISGIPKMKKEDKNIAIRFTKLIDALYNHKTKLICTAAVKPEELYTDGEQAFEFERTVSRLNEMQSKFYFEFRHRC